MHDVAVRAHQSMNLDRKVTKDKTFFSLLFPDAHLFKNKEMKDSSLRLEQLEKLQMNKYVSLGHQC